jgi:hypothetical protein
MKSLLLKNDNITFRLILLRFALKILGGGGGNGRDGNVVFSHFKYPHKNKPIN